MLDNIFSFLPLNYDTIFLKNQKTMTSLRYIDQAEYFTSFLFSPKQSMN